MSNLKKVLGALLSATVLVTSGAMMASAEEDTVNLMPENMGAITANNADVTYENGKLVIDEKACNHCGRCVSKCPFKAVDYEQDGYRVCIGGRWGKKVAQGRCLDKVFTDKDEVLDVLEKAILLFREQGVTGERFADTVARLGFENVQAELLSDRLLQQKRENLSAQKHLKGGATC